MQMHLYADVCIQFFAAKKKISSSTSISGYLTSAGALAGWSPASVA